MAAVSVRDLDEAVREQLRRRAAANGRSMEAEIRAILTAAVAPPRDPHGLAQSLLSRFSDLGGLELDVPARCEPPRAADLLP
ncbi:MAG: antitoxin FitA [Frankiaceae bacterium]|jgi:plasmid stability protein|nr:antitoxin FitA [Frankiaceae bacterium]